MIQTNIESSEISENIINSKKLQVPINRIQEKDEEGLLWYDSLLAWALSNNAHIGPIKLKKITDDNRYFIATQNIKVNFI